jgi:hypothetical protein
MTSIVYADTASKHGHPSARRRKRHFGDPAVPSKDSSLPAAGSTLTSASTVTTSLAPSCADLASNIDKANTADRIDEEAEGPHPMDMTLEEVLGSLENDSEDIESDVPSTAASPLPRKESLLLANIFDYPASPLVTNTSCRRTFDQYWKAGRRGLQIEEQAQEHVISQDGGHARTSNA